MTLKIINDNGMERFNNIAGDIESFCPLIGGKIVKIERFDSKISPSFLNSFNESINLCEFKGMVWDSRENSGDSDDWSSETGSKWVPAEPFWLPSEGEWSDDFLKKASFAVFNQEEGESEYCDKILDLDNERAEFEAYLWDTNRKHKITDFQRGNMEQEFSDFIQHQCVMESEEIVEKMQDRKKSFPFISPDDVDIEQIGTTDKVYLLMTPHNNYAFQNPQESFTSDFQDDADDIVSPDYPPSLSIPWEFNRWNFRLESNGGFTLINDRLKEAELHIAADKFGQKLSLYKDRYHDLNLKIDKGFLK
jgi:hypothetical protein